MFFPGQHKYRMQWLAGVTAFMLCGIIALQVYWLITSYRQQRSRFTADIENAVVASMVKMQLESEMFSPQAGIMEDSLMGQLSRLTGQPVNRKTHIARSTTIISLNDSGMMETSRSSGVFNLVAGQAIPSGSVTVLDDSLLRETGRQHYLARCYKTMEQQMADRDIHMHFELALLDRKDHVITATCAPAAFEKMPLLSSSMQIGLMSGYRLQAAFPNANLLLLRRMLWLLVLSILLIALVIISFSYLVLHFFRHKKISDIRNDFMNNMTHELKTPISSVSVAIELMRDKRFPLTEVAREEYLDIAQGELKRLHMLVEKVLKMAAFERSEIRISPESFGAKDWIDDVINSFRPMTDAAGAEVTVTVQPLQLRLFADRVHLTNVLQNLLENALKYNDKSQPRIKISVQELIGKIQIEVTDNGKGIPAAYLDKVFDKFFRVPTGDRHDQAGYGLGLSYVQAVILLHKGTIQVQSKPGAGSTFIIQLPLKPIA